MAVILINLAKCALRGIRQSVRDIFKIELAEIPQYIREELTAKPHLVAERDEVAALVKLKHEAIQGSGFISAIMPKKNLKKCISQSGFPEKITDEIMGDALGELVSMIAGAFKKELFNLGRGLINISVPKYFIDGVDGDIEDVEVFSHYVITVKHEKEYLMTVELAFQSVAFTEGEDKKDTSEHAAEGEPKKS